ncbi:phosphonate C-P lyase system protein PhnG [Sporosarcina sp. P21c]|uniref:phosphonate C-P lyase system protein PhnG n=1 Tax=unclassified Sporosarcina TaxID=2647733 RepID=UPI000C16596F|nr:MULTISPECIES: phosphonate C-P lyase system protein PhnG [unclassified Sporosarcina]PIC66473.1 phosphonate C-P lyase system protein PhnG [Sporosarcina sp. P16a]PIC82322.1 phosphonate C-P lyase system protein PhnG [Sporosarcina sp. P1]PIC88505.1 phosphonate C-P lyase system protein PhnG [Sporosarcina sp. P21c]PIC92059.1 phosphonate C-P lyase system protein PhnG [Sporosarcina sp. P25]
MKRRKRTEILIQERGHLAKVFAETITAAYECREITAPQYGMTMIKMRETAKNSLFYMGEVLVTEVKVEIANRIGIGIVAGMEEELAKHLAIIDAAYKAELPETSLWEPQLIAAEDEIRKEKARRQAELIGTKVNFETMEI